MSGGVKNETVVPKAASLNTNVGCRAFMRNPRVYLSHRASLESAQALWCTVIFVTA